MFRFQFNVCWEDDRFLSAPSLILQKSFIKPTIFENHQSVYSKGSQIHCYSLELKTLKVYSIELLDPPFSICNSDIKILTLTNFKVFTHSKIFKDVKSS